MSDIRHNHGGKFERREIDLPTGPLSFFIGGNGPPYLHMHGAGGLRISHSLQELTKTYQVFIPIIPGFDDMPFHEEVNSYLELADMFADFWQAEIATPCPVSGHAMGGRLTIWYATLHCDKTQCAIIQCPSGLRPDGQVIMPFSQYQKGVMAHPEKVADENRSQTVMEANRDAGYHYHAPGKGVIDKTIFCDHDMVARLGEITCPTLILQGAIDAVLPPESVEFLASQVAESRLVYLQDAGHLIDMDQPERWLRLIRELITESWNFNPSPQTVGG